MRYLGIFLMFSFGVFAQKVRPFVGGSVYLDTDFDKSSFGDIRTGMDYKVAYYLRPEVGIEYMFGNLENIPKYDSEGYFLSEYFKRVTALNFTFCPKIILGAKDEDSDYIQILPKYTYSKIEANGRRVAIDPNKPSKTIEEREKIVDYQHSIGIGLGYVFDISSKNDDSIALNIYFNNIDLGNALNMLKQDRRFKTDDVLGFGVSYYFSFKKKK